MKNYKGYYIDKVIFNSEKEIDDFLKNKAVNAYRQAVELFAIHSTMENSIYCGERTSSGLRGKMWKRWKLKR